MASPDPSRRLTTGAAPGKVILFGEHAAVYGRPAVAAALGCGLGATVEADADGPVLHLPAWGLTVRLRGGPDGGAGFESLPRAFAAALDGAGLRTPAERAVSVTLDGALPPSVGLGSSAAFAVSLLRALSAWTGAPLADAALLEAAFAVEQVFHGTPSGVDHTVATLGGCLRFQRGATPTYVRVPIGRPVPLVVAFAPRHTAGRDVVAGLRARWAAHPGIYERLFDAIGEITAAGETALAAGDLAGLGRLFDLNHDVLRACGVSSPVNDELVALARRHGASGAKLTGAGGGGAVIALVPGDAGPLLQAVSSAGYAAFATTLDEP
jgi:hydroxymethylglutaryl-CoA reductase